MKKNLILSIAVMLFSFSVFAQTTIKLPFNQYSGQTPNLAFQAKDISKIATDYTAKKGDIITVHIAGTSNYAMSKFQVALVDTRAAVSYWKELGGFKDLGAVTAGVAFDFTVDIAVTVDGAGAGSGFSNLILDAVSQAAIDGAATDVTLTLTTYDVTFTAAQSGVTTLTSNGAGAYQLSFPDTLSTATPLKVGNVVKIELDFTSLIDITDFQAVIVDETVDASYYTQLSDFENLSPGPITANTPYSLISYDTINTAPKGTGFKSQDIFLTGKATGNIGLKITKFKATILQGIVGIAESNTISSNILRSNVVTENTLTLNQVVSSANIFNLQGSLVKSASSTNSINVSGLTAGMYFIQTNEGSSKFLVK